MTIKLFDIENGVVIPTEHCYTLSTLKDLMDKYPDDYLKVYQYLFYMTCPNPDLNDKRREFIIDVISKSDRIMIGKNRKDCQIGNGC